MASGKNQKNGKIVFMNNIEFDSKIKELVDSCQEPLNEDLWGAIEDGLERRRTIFVVRRVAAVAVAAAVVVALVLNVRSAETIMNDTMTSSVVIKPLPMEIDTEFPGALRKLAYLEPKVHTADEVATPVVENEEERKELVQGDQVEQTVKANTEGNDIYTDYDWDLLLEDQEKGKRGVILDFASNVLALGGDSEFSKITMYMPGASMVTQQTIAPISRPAFALPVTVGLNVQIPFSDKFAVGTGVRYSFLQNSFQALIDNSAQALVRQKLHYLGVPLSVYYSFVSGRNLSCYITAGGLMEKGLHISNEIKDLKDGLYYRKGKIDGLQWSANIGLGFEYLFTNFFGIYLDPSLVYFFDCDQPYSIRVAQPLQFELELGLRFKL